MLRGILSWVLWPLTVVGIAVAVTYGADPSDPASVYPAMGVAMLVSLVVLVMLEWVLPYRKDWKLRGDRDLLRDVGHYVLYSQLGGTGAQLVFLVGFASVIGQLSLPSVWPVRSPVVVQILLVMVLGDLLEYWLHRLSHSVPMLWRVHAVHHMPTRLHMLKAGRHHVLYFFLRGLIVWTPLLLVGAPAALIVWQIVAIGLTGNVAHANIDFKIPKFMHRILVTPEFHRLHHSVDRLQGNTNFGVMLPFWDSLFGTHTDPVTTPLPGVGIDGHPIPHRWFMELGWPLLPRRVEARLATAGDVPVGVRGGSAE